MVWITAPDTETRSRARSAGAVPGERGDPVAGFHAQPSQGLGKLARPAVRFAVGVAVDAPSTVWTRSRAAVVALGMLDHAGNQERHVHHQALHDDFLLSSSLS